MKFSAKGSQEEKFQSKVWAILMNEHREVYEAAQRNEAQIDEWINMGNENGYDEESIADAIVQSFKG